MSTTPEEFDATTGEILPSSGSTDKILHDEITNDGWLKDPVPQIPRSDQSHMPVRSLSPDEEEDVADEEDDNVQRRLPTPSEMRWRRAGDKPRGLLSRGSRAIRVEEIDPDTGQWRTKIKMTRKKILEEEKGIFLEEYSKWGRMGDAAARIACSTNNIREEMKRDPEFAEGVLLAEETYRERLIGHHQDLVFNGTLKETYGKDGKVVSREHIFPIRLIELELKKHDAGYRDRQEVAVSVSGGVLVAPADAKTIDDWEQRFSLGLKDITPVTDKD